ncbi:MAG: UDP-N-acetylmuramate--L-alanine ligase [Pseudomonadota bacterium]
MKDPSTINDSWPDDPRSVHLVGACGVGMAGVAGLFLSSGRAVTGSDQAIYPPMSAYLERIGVKVSAGYSPENLSPRPDLVVVGNVIKKDNPEARAVENLQIPFLSMPEAIEKYFLNDKLSIVVAGSHGKTTVSSMISWILYDQGRDPSFLIGGLPLNFDVSSRLGQGEVFVIEGDEYDSAYFDKRPKFLSYRPFIGIVTSCEFDHCDIYQNIMEIRVQFEKFLGLIPESGSILAYNDDPVICDIIRSNNFRVETYGLSSEALWNLSDIKDTGSGMHADFNKDLKTLVTGTLPVIGRHNLLNALVSVAAVSKVGIEPRDALDSLRSFRGVARRQQTSCTDSNITLIDDFAHHPSEVRETLAGFRLRFPERRLVAVFEPRTNTSRRSIFQETYVESFLQADLIALREPPDPWKAPQGDLFSSVTLAQELVRRGRVAQAFPDANSIVNFLAVELRRGDVVIVMSNGNFENLIARLFERLEGDER